MPKPLYQIKAYKAGFRSVSIFLEEKLNCRISFLLAANVRITFRKLQVKANLVFRLFNAFFRNQSTKKRVCVFSHSVALTSSKVFSKLDKSTLEQLCKNSSPKRKYFEIQKSQTRFGVLHVKLHKWPHNSP